MNKNYISFFLIKNFSELYLALTNEKERTAVLNEHNKLRSLLANGKAENKDKSYLPSGKNILLLVIWFFKYKLIQ